MNSPTESFRFESHQKLLITFKKGSPEMEGSGEANVPEFQLQQERVERDDVSADSISQGEINGLIVRLERPRFYIRQTVMNAIRKLYSGPQGFGGKKNAVLFIEVRNYLAENELLPKAKPLTLITFQRALIQVLKEDAR
jgi:hypothetical protein